MKNILKNIIRLDDISKADVSVAGGKGANLGELKKAGFPVPDGFVISANAYRAIIEKSGIEGKIADILSAVGAENPSGLENASSRIQALIAAQKFSKSAEKEILESYKKLGGLVAVRSSATAEDLESASFAGQQATFLNVAECSIIESVKLCMASLFTARAIFYRAQNRISHTDVSIAVVVQKMVDSKSAGVAFSANPVTGNKGEIVIEAASGSGSGARVVGGEIIPDNYVVANANGALKITERRISKSPVLSDSEISALSSIVSAIEKHYHAPQDIEWAIGGSGKIWVLQARPITALKSAPMAGMPEKSAWKKIMAREYGVQYTEMSLRALSPECGFAVPAPFYGQAYIPEDKNEAMYMNKAEWNAFVSSLKEKYLGNPAASVNFANYEEFEKLFLKTGSDYVKTASLIAKSSLKEKSNGELKKLYLKYQKKSLRYAPFIWIQFLINNFFAEKAKEIISKKLENGESIGRGKTPADNEAFHALYGAALMPDKKASAMQLGEIASVWEKLDDTVRTEIYEKFKWIPCMDIHNRPWTKEEFGAHMAGFKKPENCPKSSGAHCKSFESAIKTINPSKEEMQIIDIAKRLAYLKDLKDDFRRQGVFFGQTLFEEIANRMSIKLKLEAAIKLEDVSYLLESEIVGFLDNGLMIPKNIIESRKNGFVIYYAVQNDCTHQNKIICASGNEIAWALNALGIADKAADSAAATIDGKFSEEIKGVPASLGKAKGIARIVKTVSDLAKVKKGDILVAITTHPDFVPAMQRAAAIVTDEGGITCHAAIVAREFGLPCIVGTRRATKLLKDGDEIEVDAVQGIVRKLK